MESLCVGLGFRDSDFLSKLNSQYFAVVYPKSNQNTHADFHYTRVIDFDSLQITLQEDTIEHPYSLAFFQFSNFLNTTINVSHNSKLFLTTVFFMDYYNIPLGY